MRRPRGVPNHELAPKEWRRTPNMSGDYDLDATIIHRKNRDMAKKLDMHITKRAYKPKSGYRGGGYSGYHGDD